MVQVLCFPVRGAPKGRKLGAGKKPENILHVHLIKGGDVTNVVNVSSFVGVPLIVWKLYVFCRQRRLTTQRHGKRLKETSTLLEQNNKT